MRATWKGVLAFGMVSIPVKLYKATETNDVSFRQVHAEDGGRIHYKRVCDADGEEVAYADIAKGYELPDGGMVVLDKNDLNELPIRTAKIVDVLEFVPAEQVDAIMADKSYYIGPDGDTGAKPYILLREALAESGKTAVVKVALRGREALATVRPYEDVLLLQTLLWPDEIRQIAGLAPEEDVTVRPQEVAMARSLIETLGADFEPSEFKDEYKGAVEALVASKTGGEAFAPAASDEDDGNVIDLVAALQASIDAIGGKPAKTAAKKTAAKKRTA